MSSPNQRKDDNLLRPELGRSASSSQRVSSGVYGSPPVIPNIPLRGTAGAGAATAAASEHEDLSRSPARRLSPRPSSSNLQVPAGSGSGSASNSQDPSPSLTPNAAEELTDEQKAEIVARHLVDKKGQRRASRSASNAGRPGPMSRSESQTGNNDNVEDDDGTHTATDEEEDVERIRHMQMSTEEFPVSRTRHYVIHVWS